MAGTTQGPACSFTRASQAGVAVKFYTRRHVLRSAAWLAHRTALLGAAGQQWPAAQSDSALREKA